MNKIDIIRKHIGNDDFYDMNGTPLLAKILAAMDEYAQQQVKNFSIPDRVEQSTISDNKKQLKTFAVWLQKKIWAGGDKDFDELVEEFLNL